MPRTIQRTRIQDFIVTSGDEIRGEDLTVGGDVLMRGGNSTGGNNGGGSMTVQGGTGDGNGSGGMLFLNAGGPGGTGAGADVSILASNSAAASGVGGSILLTAGDATGTDNAGDLSLTAGFAGGSGTDGQILLSTGTPGDTTTDGSVYIDRGVLRGGGGGSSYPFQLLTEDASLLVGGEATSPLLYLAAADSGTRTAGQGRFYPGGVGGAVDLRGGTASSGFQDGGSVFITGGDTAPLPGGGDGGIVYIRGGDAQNGTGGSVSITTGTGTDASGGGDVTVTLGAVTGGFGGTGGGFFVNGNNLTDVDESGGSVAFTLADLTNAANNNDGGSFTVTAGSTTGGGSGDGGSITLTPGTAAGAGAAGDLVFSYATWPSADGAFGTALTTDGAGALTWAQPRNLQPPPLVGLAAGPGFPGETIQYDPTAGAVTITLPVLGALVPGDRVTFKNITASVAFGLIITAGAGSTVEDPAVPGVLGAVTTPIVGAGATFTYEFSGATGGWWIV